MASGLLAAEGYYQQAHRGDGLKDIWLQVESKQMAEAANKKEAQQQRRL